MTCNNKYIRILLFSIFLTLIYYLYRRLSFEFGRVTFNLLYDEFINNLNLGKVQRIRLAYQFFIDLIYVLLINLILKKIAFLKKMEKDYLTFFFLVPIIMDLSDIIYDKTCLKPWINYNNLLWYLPMRLILWSIIIFFSYHYLKKIKFNHILIFIISLTTYTIIKPF